MLSMGGCRGKYCACIVGRQGEGEVHYFVLCAGRVGIQVLFCLL